MREERRKEKGDENIPHLLTFCQDAFISFFLRVRSLLVKRHVKKDESSDDKEETRTDPPPRRPDVPTFFPSAPGSGVPKFLPSSRSGISTSSPAPCVAPSRPDSIDSTF